MTITSMGKGTAVGTVQLFVSDEQGIFSGIGLRSCQLLSCRRILG